MHKLSCHKTILNGQSTSPTTSTIINHSNTCNNNSTMASNKSKYLPINWHPENAIPRNGKDDYCDHFVEMPTALVAFNRKYDYPYAPSHSIFIDKLLVKRPKKVTPAACLKEHAKALAKLKEAKILNWKPDDLVKYHSELSDQQKLLFDSFDYGEDKPEETSKFDVTLAACLTQQFINLLYKPGLGAVQFWEDENDIPLPEGQRFKLDALVSNTYHQVKYIIWWMAKIMAHRDYYWDKNDRDWTDKCNYYDTFTPAERFRFDQILRIWIHICPEIPIYVHHKKYGTFNWLPAETTTPPRRTTTKSKGTNTKGKQKKATNTKSFPKSDEPQLDYMRVVLFDNARKYIREFPNKSAISTKFLGLKYVEALDNNHPMWDNNKLTAKEAEQLWSRDAALLPLCVLFGTLQGWRNKLTATANASKKYSNAPKDLLYITPEEAQIINEDFPTLINPPEVPVNRPPVPNYKVKPKQRKQTSTSKEKKETQKKVKSLHKNKYFETI